jgi:hypothetical protein
MKNKNCALCATMTNWLELFPGDVCIECWAKSPAGKYMPSASELAQMWGAK